jgi:peptidoglycan/LPS O-acetylase OafA/YrhL
MLKTQRFESLDSLRGVAALFIALVHFPAIFAGAQFTPLRHAYLLTNLFFMLSGFILMSAYAHKLQGWQQWGSFARARLWRLVPLHVLTTGTVLLSPYVAYLSLVGLTWAFTGGWAGAMPWIEVPLEHLVVHLLMLQGFGLLDELVLNFPAWSMGALFFCSLLLAALLAVLHSPAQRAWALAVLAVLGTVVIAALAPAYMGATYDWGIFRAVASFFAGSLLFLAWQRWGLRQDRAQSWALVWQALALALFFYYLTWARADGARSMLSLLVMAALLWAFTADRTDFGRLLAWRGFKWLSERSYSLFMNQAALLFIGHQASDWMAYFRLGALGATVAGTAAALLYLGLLLWLSDLTYRHVELRFAPRAKAAPAGKAAGAGPKVRAPASGSGASA